MFQQIRNTENLQTNFLAQFNHVQSKIKNGKKHENRTDKIIFIFLEIYFQK